MGDEVLSGCADRGKADERHAGTSLTGGSVQFRAICAPTDQTVAQLAAIDPANPFRSVPYLHALKAAGKQVWLFASGPNETPLCGCLGTVRRGLINRTLHIESAPETVSTEFWDGIKNFCRANGFHHLDISTVASACRVPRLPLEISRTSRFEYVLLLQERDIESGMRENHRRNRRKALNAGVKIRETRDDSAYDTHFQLVQASMARHGERGEQVPQKHDDHFERALLKSGAARLFQAVLNDVVISSVLIIDSAKGAYYRSAGNSSESLASGASVLLLSEIALSLQAEEKFVLNLAAAPPDSSLANFKIGFGAVAQESESAEFYFGSQIRKKLGVLAKAGLSSPSSLATAVLGQVHRSIVFCADKSPEPVADPPDTVFRKLTDEEVQSLPCNVASLKAENRARFERFGVNRAYAVFVRGKLAHVSWSLTRDMVAHQGDHLLNLHDDEIEITACVTLPEFRGRGLYAYAIHRIIEHERASGAARVLMKTRAGNIASQKGILKAGLRRIGDVIHVQSRFVPHRELVIRRYKRH